MEYVQGGPIADFFKKLTDSLLKSLEGIFNDAETKIVREKGKLIRQTSTKNEVLDENGKPLPFTAAEALITITLQWPKDEVMDRASAEKLLNDPKTWNDAEDVTLEISFKGGNKLSRSNISYVEAHKEFNKYSEKFNLRENATYLLKQDILLFNEGDPRKNKKENQGEDTNSSKKLNMSLIKIAGSKDIEVNLTSINANYNLLEAMNDVNNVVADDDFVEQLPENEEVFFEVTSDEDDYDVNPCEPFDCLESLQQMISITMQLMLDMRVLKMTAGGDNYEMILNVCDSVLYPLDTILMALADALYDENATGIDDFNFYTETSAYSRLDSFEVIAEKVKTYLACLDVIYENLGKGTKTKIDYSIQQIEDAIRTSTKKI